MWQEILKNFAFWHGTKRALARGGRASDCEVALCRGGWLGRRPLVRAAAAASEEDKEFGMENERSEPIWLGAEPLFRAHGTYCLHLPSDWMGLQVSFIRPGEHQKPDGPVARTIFSPDNLSLRSRSKSVRSFVSDDDQSVGKHRWLLAST
jgi:hypothetical protein